MKYDHVLRNGYQGKSSQRRGKKSLMRSLQDFLYLKKIMIPTMRKKYTINSVGENTSNISRTVSLPAFLKGSWFSLNTFLQNTPEPNSKRKLISKSLSIILFFLIALSFSYPMKASSKLLVNLGDFLSNTTHKEP